jgi:hypothetical protein
MRWPSSWENTALMPVMQPSVLFSMSFSLFLSVRPIALQGQEQVGQGRLEHGVE